MAVVVNGNFPIDGSMKEEQEKTITAKDYRIEVLPDENKTMSKVTVDPTPSYSKTVTPTGATVNYTPNDGYHFKSFKIMGDSNLIAGNIRKSKTIFGVTGTMEEAKQEQEKEVHLTPFNNETVYPDEGKVLNKVTIHYPEFVEKNVTPSATEQYVLAGKGKLLGGVRVYGDSDLIAKNILENKTIFGVTGNVKKGIKATIDGVEQTEDLELFSGDLAIEDVITITGVPSGDYQATYLDGSLFVKYYFKLYKVYKSGSSYASTEITNQLIYPNNHLVSYQGSLYAFGDDIIKITASGTLTTVQSLPSDIKRPDVAISASDGVHIIKGNKHYLYNGYSATQRASLPFTWSTQYGSSYAVVNNKILIKADLTFSEYYEYNGNWVSHNISNSAYAQRLIGIRDKIYYTENRTIYDSETFEEKIRLKLSDYDGAVLLCNSNDALFYIDPKNKKIYAVYHALRKEF